MHSSVSTDAQAAVALSVVVPVYLGESCLEELYRRSTTVLDDMVGAEGWELLLVDDRGPDGSWREIQRISAGDPRVRGMRLSRNFGQEAATSAGLANARGEWIVTMDCDLQDRPEDIPRIYSKAQEGFQNVRARRAKAGKLHRVWGTRLYFWLLNRMAGTDVDWRFAAFGIMSAQVRDAYLAVPDRRRNLLLVLNWLGFESTWVDVAHDERFAGKSSYSLRKLIGMAVSGIFFQTTAPLRWIVYLGLAESLLGIVVASVIIIRKFTIGYVVPGWTSLITAILVTGGFTIAALGIAALYLGSIFDQVKARPRYIIEDDTRAMPTGAAVGARIESPAAV